MMRSANRLLLTATIAFVAAGGAALVLLLLPLVWFVAVLLSCAVFALAAAAWIRRDRARAQREAIEEAHAARLADLNRQADALKARERAIENAQMSVLRSFRREHGL
jgi:hypothetical protein